MHDLSHICIISPCKITCPHKLVCSIFYCSKFNLIINTLPSIHYKKGPRNILVFMLNWLFLKIRFTFIMHDGGVHKTYIPKNKIKMPPFFIKFPLNTRFYMSMSSWNNRVFDIWNQNYPFNLSQHHVKHIFIGVTIIHNWFFIIYIYKLHIFLFIFNMLRSKEFHPSCPNEIQLVCYFHYQYPNGENFLMSQVVIFIFCIHTGNVHWLQTQ